MAMLTISRESYISNKRIPFLFDLKYPDSTEDLSSCEWENIHEDGIQSVKEDEGGWTYGITFVSEEHKIKFMMTHL